MPRKQKRRPWGSITPVTRTKHVVRWVENTPEGRVRKSKTVCGTYREADRFLAEKRMSVEKPVSMTVGELWRDYERPQIGERAASGSMSHATVRQYASTWDRHVAPKWGKTPCTEVRPLDVQKWILSKSCAVGRLARVVLKKTLDHAVMFDLIQSNPADKRFRFSDAERKEKAAYTLEQLARLEEVVRGSVCEVPFLFCAHAGMRVGEACGVPLENVRFEGDCAVVSVTSQLSETGQSRARLKTASSRRAVALPKPWCDRLRDIVDALPPKALWANDDGLGEPVARWLVGKTWEALVKASDLPYLPMQALRPSYGTIMHWRAGVPIEQVSRIMGHRQTSTTLGHYDRPGGGELVSVAVEAAARLAKIS